MSVVNQMLRDLDRREADGERRVFGQHLRSVESGRRGPWLVGGVVMVAAAGAVAVYLTGFGTGTPPTQVAAAAPTPAPIETQAPARTLAATAPASSAVAPAPTADSPQPKPVDVVAPALAPVAAAQVTVAPVAAAQATVAPVAAPPVAPAPVEPKRVQSVPAARNAPPAAAAPTTRVAMQKPHPVVEKPTSVATAAEPTATEVKIDKQFRDSPTRSAEAEFQRAAALIERGRIEEATASLRSAVALDPRNEAARQTLAVLLIESRALDEAETVLADGLRLNPAQANFALVLARLRLDRGDPGGALAVLREHGAAAAANPEYRAFVAALLQRLGRHGEAIDEYQAALKLAPQVGVWWVGLGLAQESAERPKDAADAFRQAKAVGNLSPNLADFVDRKLQAAR